MLIWTADIFSLFHLKNSSLQNHLDVANEW